MCRAPQPGSFPLTRTCVGLTTRASAMSGSANEIRLMREGEVITRDRPTSKCNVCGSEDSCASLPVTGVVGDWLAGAVAAGACAAGTCCVCARMTGAARRAVVRHKVREESNIFLTLVIPSMDPLSAARLNYQCSETTCSRAYCR